MHLLIAISSHGYGHLAQCRTLIWSLLNNGFNGTLSVQCEYDSAFIKQRLGISDINVYNVATEPTIPMRDALTVDTQQLLKLYQFESVFQDRILEQNMALQRQIGCDAIISNVGFYPLWAAQLQHKPNAAFCCLNWADIVDYYATNEQKKTVEKIRELYLGADFFGLTIPYMPARWLTNTKIIDPIITPNPDGQLPAKDKFNPDEIDNVFITASNAAIPIDFASLPQIKGLTWSINQLTNIDRQDIVAVQSSNFDAAFNHSNIVVSKPGYGLFTECAWRLKPVISINRLDWPEQDELLKWMRAYGTVAEIPLAEFSSERVLAAIESLKEAKPAQPFTVGNDNLAKLVMNWLKA